MITPLRVPRKFRATRWRVPAGSNADRKASFFVPNASLAGKHFVVITRKQFATRSPSSLLPSAASRRDQLRAPSAAVAAPPQTLRQCLRVRCAPSPRFTPKKSSFPLAPVSRHGRANCCQSLSATPAVTLASFITRNSPSLLRPHPGCKPSRTELATDPALTASVFSKSFVCIFTTISIIYMFNTPLGRCRAHILQVHLFPVPPEPRDGVHQIPMTMRSSSFPM